MDIGGITSNNLERYRAGNSERKRAVLQKNDMQKSFKSKASASIVISEEGKNILREMVNRLEPESDDMNFKELTIQNTNEVAWEQYMAMRDISSRTLKGGNYNADDIMKSIKDTYEVRYNEILKEHERGTREVSYGLTGKRALTLEEDLAGLDEAFRMRLANLEGYLTCQRTNRAFKNPDSSWYFNRNRL